MKYTRILYPSQTHWEMKVHRQDNTILLNDGWMEFNDSLTDEWKHYFIVVFNFI